MAIPRMIMKSIQFKKTSELNLLLNRIEKEIRNRRIQQTLQAFAGLKERPRHISVLIAMLESELASMTKTEESIEDLLDEIEYNLGLDS